MINKCSNCQIIQRQNSSIFVCPYSEEEFGLENSKECRERVINEIKFLKTFPSRIIFTNLSIRKTYSYYNIKEYYRFFNFLNSKINKLKTKFYLKLSDIQIKNFLLEPVEFIKETNLNIEKLSKLFKKIPFMKEVIDYIDMEYETKLAYMRLFENETDIDERLLMGAIIKETLTHQKFTVKIVNINKRNLYYIKLEDGEICDEDSPLKLLERMDGESKALRKLIVALLDENVQEVYLDRENSWVYLDHSKYGRCDTNVFLSSVDVEKIKTFINMVSGDEISIGEASLKTSLTDRNVKLRIAIDVFPIVPDTSIDIRRFGSKFLTIKDLINKEAIELDLAAFLIFCIRRRLSLVICGEPNSGKTTLAHALSSYLPLYMRRIYLEDVDELYSASAENSRRVFIRTRSLDVSGKYSNKATEVIRLLHRSPDWIFLGEIQTKEHARAFFHALMAGLRGVATCHAKSAEELIKRWMLQYSIHPLSIISLDMIVEMEKEIHENRIVRRVKAVYEIFEDNSNPSLHLIYKRNIKNFYLNEDFLFKSISIKKIIERDNIKIDEIVKEINNIKNLIIYG